MMASRKSTLYTQNNDQYYTTTATAQLLVDMVKPFITEQHTILEPSAGTGVFVDAMKDYAVEAYDIDPKHPAVIEQDFLKAGLLNKPYVTIGNPPFGGHSTSLAVNFFNKCAGVSDYIAFIVPRSFRKQSIQNRLDLNFHLLLDEDCPKNSFIMEDNLWDVSTCMQVWKKEWHARSKPTFQGKYFTAHKTGTLQDGDFFMRYYGRNCGAILPDDYSGSLNTVRIIRPKVPNLKETIATLDFTTEKYNVGSMMCINNLEIERKLDETSIRHRNGRTIK